VKSPESLDTAAFEKGADSLSLESIPNRPRVLFEPAPDCGEDARRKDVDVRVYECVRRIGRLGSGEEPRRISRSLHA
jgi:hypothetical protein